jgi:hypothetical protein
MYQTSLFFRIKNSSTAFEKYRIIEYFFKYWVDDTCNNEVDYSVESVSTASIDSRKLEELVRVDFEHIEDAVAIKLKGVPREYQPYIEIVG